MKNRAILFFVTLMILALGSLSGCKKANDSSDATIREFTIRFSEQAPDVSQLKFTIDAANMRIYCNDSVAYTSNVTALVPVLFFNATPSSIYVNGNKWNQSDPLDLSGELEFTITAANKKATKSYKFNLLKHTVNADSLVWQKWNVDLGVELDSAKVFYTDNIFVLCGANQTNQYVFTSSDARTWTKQSEESRKVRVPTAYLKANRTSADEIYALGSDNLIYRIDAETYKFVQVTETPLEHPALDIVGLYNDYLLIATYNGVNVKMFRCESDGTVSEAEFNDPESFPLSGAAKLLVRNDKKSESGVYVSYLFGGVDKDGDVLMTALSTDNGWYWTDVNDDVKGYMPAVTNTAVALYDKKLFMLGGEKKFEGEYLDKAYISEDYGFSWSVAKSYQMPPLKDIELKSSINLVSDISGNMFILGGHKADGKFYMECHQARAVHMDFKKQ